MAGGHLDSVPEGPGLNDNGSGVAAVLEMAEELGGRPLPDGTALRFGFWGAEEIGLVGSTDYVDGLSRAERRRITAYVNLDMVGSPGADAVGLHRRRADRHGAAAHARPGRAEHHARRLPPTTRRSTRRASPRAASSPAWTSATTGAATRIEQRGPRAGDHRVAGRGAALVELLRAPRRAARPHRAERPRRRGGGEAPRSGARGAQPVGELSSASAVAASGIPSAGSWCSAWKRATASSVARS